MSLFLAFNICSSIFLVSRLLQNGVQLPLRNSINLSRDSIEKVGICTLSLQEGRFQVSTALSPVSVITPEMFSFQKEDYFEERRSGVLG